MNIILAGKVEWTQEDLEVLSGNGKNDIFFCPDEESPSPVVSEEADAVICNWFFKYHDIHTFKRLKYIQLTSVGYNGIDPEVVKSMGIILHNAKDVYSIPISEFVVGSILAYYKRFAFFFENRNKHLWQKNRGLHELFDRKVLIVGTGSIGNEVAKRLNGFTEEIYGCNRTVREDPLYREIYSLNDLPYIVSGFDVIILSIALTEGTKHLFDRNIFENLKKDALLVNVSRGSVINESDLVVFLTENKEAGAILDVFEEEPLPEDSLLWEMPSVLVTPHNAFVSDKNNERLRRVILNNFTLWKKPVKKTE